MHQRKKTVLSKRQADCESCFIPPIDGVLRQTSDHEDEEGEVTEDIYGEVAISQQSHIVVNNKKDCNNTICLQAKHSVNDHHHVALNTCVESTPLKSCAHKCQCTRYRCQNFSSYSNVLDTPRTMEGDSSLPKPQLPYKPHYLRANYNCSNVPPLPPRIVNTSAIVQRKLLTERYFENIRRCIDNNVENNDCENSSDNHKKTPTNNLPGKSITNEATTGVSVQIPGTERCPYWTIKEVSSEVLCQNCKRTVSHYECENGVVCHTGVTDRDSSMCASSSSKQLQSVHCNDTQSDLLDSLCNLKKCGWYWGNMSWEDAELMLSQQPNEEGLFLVRDSQDPLHLLTLTVRSYENSIHHIRIEFCGGKFQLYDSRGTMSQGTQNYVRHQNIIQFIKIAVNQSRSGTFVYFVKTRNMGEPPVQIRLLTPVSRFACVKSLKYYCRFKIREAVPKDLVDNLPVPDYMKAYLLMSPYFDRDEDLICGRQP